MKPLRPVVARRKGVGLAWTALGVGPSENGKEPAPREVSVRSFQLSEAESSLPGAEVEYPVHLSPPATSGRLPVDSRS